MWPATPGRRSRSCLADAAHQRAGRAIRRAGEGLALDQRQRKRHARNLADAIRDRLVVGQRRLDPLQEHVAVKADHLLHEVMPEAVHHRHDDNERRDPEHDAEEGKPGDDRDRLLRVARAQVAERDHPFEGARTAASPAPARRRRLDGGGHARPLWRMAEAVRVPLATGDMNSVTLLPCKGAPGHCRLPSITPSRRAWRSPPRCSTSSRSPLAAGFDLDLALAEALRSDDDLVRRADQVHGGEFRAGALVAVVVEHVDAGLFSAS